MIPSNTICVSQEGPANALALNKDCTQVVIAGRNVFKVFSIGENDFSEVCNLRVGKNLNLNFSSIDVAWSTIEENTLATAATNGAVVVWNLGRSGRSKQEHVFSDHKRTVNKVSFHLTEPALLISGSQDGMMKCFDLRMKEVARTFISNTESIRDVQFSPHQAHTFAAVSENGNVQLWDVRRHERCLLQFTAHSGPVFACDWHPEMPWLATASRDKTIKVWDIYGKPNLEHTIYTIASVGHVKWRPQKKFQVASCALVLDCAVHVWDVRRPHVPLATFAEHRDVTTAIAWLAEPQSFLSTSRDCSLYRHRFSEAAHPVLWANPHGVSVSARGELAHAAPERPLPALPAAPPAPERHVPGLGRKQPTAGSLSSVAQAQLERAFPGGASSTLCRYRAATDAAIPNNLPQPAPPTPGTLPRAASVPQATLPGTTLPGATLPNGVTLPDAASLPHAASEPRAAPLHATLVYCALHYKIRGGSPHELAAHNAEVARSQNRHMVSHVWEVVRCVYSARAAAGRGTPAPPPARDSLPPRPDPPPLPPYSYTYPTNAVEEEPLEEEEEEDWAETKFHNSGVLGKPTRSIYFPPAKQPAHLRNDDTAGWVSAASAHYVDVDAADWTLPEEAFPLRTAPPPPAPPHHAPHHTSPVHHQHQHHDDKETNVHRNSGSGGGGTSPGGSSSPGSGSSGSACTAPPGLHAHYHHSMHMDDVSGEVGEGGGLAVRVGSALRPALELAPHLAAALRHHAELGDVQTACSVMLVLQEHRSDLFPYIEESLQEHWLLGYIELLQRHKLWNVATEVVRCAWLNSVWVLSQQSSVVAVCCGRCGRRSRPHAACDACHPHLRHAPDLCAVCHQVVRGLYAWCQGCSHGGHLHHMRKWMEQHQLCPAGCGHSCQLG
ncbi:WD repeat domain 24 [Anticarsia gemmatalis]|uniref:WD repeat domain 24 n=1 Tax=Anticarsia gemmatalis TaxID=129554 RepID=UPI003F7746C6